MRVCEHYHVCSMSDECDCIDGCCPYYLPQINRMGLIATVDAMCAGLNDACELIEDAADYLYKALDGEDVQAWQNDKLVEIIRTMESDARVLGDDYGVAADVLRTRAAQLREAFGVHDG